MAETEVLAVEGAAEDSATESKVKMAAIKATLIGSPREAEEIRAEVGTTESFPDDSSKGTAAEDPLPIHKKEERLLTMMAQTSKLLRTS